MRLKVSGRRRVDRPEHQVARLGRVQRAPRRSRVISRPPARCRVLATSARLEVRRCRSHAGGSSPAGLKMYSIGSSIVMMCTGLRFVHIVEHRGDRRRLAEPSRRQPLMPWGCIAMSDITGGRWSFSKGRILLVMSRARHAQFAARLEQVPRKRSARRSRTPVDRPGGLQRVDLLLVEHVEGDLLVFLRRDGLGLEGLRLPRRRMTGGARSSRANRTRRT